MTFGRVCILTAFTVALYVVGAGFYGARTGKREWSVSARRGMYVIALLAIAAIVLIVGARISMIARSRARRGATRRSR